PKQTGRLNVKGSLLTNDGSGNLIGIPPGTNGKIPIYDSSVTGGIRTDFYTGQDEFNVGTVTGATVIDFKNGISQKIILGANGISVSFLNMQPGRLYQLFVVQDSVGGRSSISFSNLHWQNDTVPVLTTTPNYGNLLELYFTGSSLLALN
ncbi:hypothetical protein, partial [Listeria monocytogenes]|uniref:hypothetical protein n=1 Tax=Listeria monocytogenes TaxID=1639 RepID=UPI000B91E25A